MRTAPVVLFSLSLFGCASVFRGPNDTVRIDSTPEGAQARKGNEALGSTPFEVSLERKRSTEITLSKPGYENTTIVPKRKINAAWITLDIITCPFSFCIPLFIDALSSRWYDVKDYNATMKPGTSAPAPASSGAVVIGPAPSAAAPPASTMSESERKATARAAYGEGIRLQEAGQCPDAIQRFEVAQKLFNAPTHLLHLAQCQAATGKLVEASETYETLVRSPLGKDAPDAFQKAQDEGKKEGAALRPRIPTLRIQVTPPPTSLANLVVKLNGSPVPPEVLGIARPVNPGHYRVAVVAAGYKESSSEVDVPEASTKALELRLVK